MTHTFYFPPEWAKQSAILLTWPHERTDWAPYLKEITETYLQMAEVITMNEKLIIAAQYPKKVMPLLERRLSPKYIQNVKVYPCKCNDTWARDHGPITIIRDDGQKFLLNFRFNGWGKKFKWNLDNAINKTLYNEFAFGGILSDEDDFVLEGGAIESDGKRTVMTTSFCQLAPNRNKKMTTKEKLDQELCARLHADRIIWIDHGKLIGDDTDGHIDTIARFAPNDTIVYMGCDDKDDEQYEELSLLEEQLKELKTLSGKPYRLIRLPMPHPIYDGYDRLPATYANFLILNYAVLVPTYKQPERDRQAMDAIQKAFPIHEIIGIDATAIIRQHGSVHCLAMQLPASTTKEGYEY